MAGSAIAALAMTAAAPAAQAQSRTGENAITQAEDAFGFRVGRESIGIYSAGNTRGFSPSAAGNVRIDGLYYDSVFGLQNLLVDSVSIKVGLSAQGYPFTAPSGIVDQKLKRPTAEAGGSFVGIVDSWGGRSAEAEGSIPISDRLSLLVAGSVGRNVFPNGTNNFNHTQAVVARWRPFDGVEVVPFWAMYNDHDDESGTNYIPAGKFLGIPDRPHHEEGPEWADIRFTGKNAGLLSSVSLGSKTVLRLGAFKSSMDRKSFFSHFLADQQPDGSGERILIADPKSRNRALSGELRLTHSILDGPRLHLLHFSGRKRDARRQFGGSDVVSFGSGKLGEKVTAPKPDFEFGELTRVRTEQMTYGFAYDGRWKEVGELSISISKADYRKTTRIPNEDVVVANAAPWLYNGTAAVILGKGVSVYAGYARGFEESGTAPSNAANRNEPLSSILTEQKDAGIQFSIRNGLRAVLGVFDLERPYFGYGAGNIFRQVGTTRSRGAEFSVSGRVTPRLNVVAGGVILRPRVTASADAQGNIGSRPFGLPTHILSLNANWTAPFLKGLQLDMSASHRGRQPATTDNAVFLPARFTANAGARYGFRLGQQQASLRVQMTNMFDNNAPTLEGPGIYGARNSRQVNGALTVDF